LVRATLLERDRAPSSHHEAERAAELGGLGAVAEQEQHGVGLAGELGQAHGDDARQHGRAIEHDQREGAGAQQEVGAPGRAGGIGGADDPEGVGVGDLRSGIERTRRVYPSDATPTGDGRRDESLGDGSLPQTGRGQQLGDPAGWQTATREDRIKGRQTGRKPGRGARGPCDDGGQLQAECC